MYNNLSWRFPTFPSAPIVRHSFGTPVRKENRTCDNESRSIKCCGELSKIEGRKLLPRNRPKMRKMVGDVMIDRILNPGPNSYALLCTQVKVL